MSVFSEVFYLDNVVCVYWSSITFEMSKIENKYTFATNPS